MSRRSLAALGPLALIPILLVPLWRLLDPSSTVAWGDATLLYGPTRGLVAEALRDGRLPLWNPYVGTGAPLFAEGMHGVLHPVSLLAALVDPAGRLEPLVLLYLLAAGIGAAVAARALQVGRAGSIAAGAAYALSGFVLSMASNLVFLAGAASAPWAVAGIVVAARGGAGGAIAAAAGTAALILSGDAQGALCALALGAALAADAGGRRGLLQAAVASAAGGAIAGIQWIPTAVHLPRTVRWELAGSWRGEWSFSPWRLPELVSPGFLFRFDRAAGLPFRHLVADCRSLGECAHPFAPSAFLGAPALLLAALGARRPGPGRVLVAAAALFLWLAMGPHLGAEQLLGSLPGWSLFRYPEKLLGPLSLAVALLAGLGIDGLAQGSPRPRLATGLGIAAAAVSVAALGLRLAPGLAESAFAAVPASDVGIGTLGSAAELARVAAVEERARLAAGLWHCALGLAGLCGVAALARGRPQAPVGAGALGAALVVIAGVASAPFAIHFSRAEPLVRPPLPPIGPATGHVRLYTPYPPPGIPGPLADLDPIEANNAMRRATGIPATNVALRIDSVGTYSGLQPLRMARLAAEIPGGMASLARRLGANTIVASWPSNPEQEARLAALRDAGSTLLGKREELAISAWSVPARPWASFAEGAVRASSPAEARLRLASVLSRGGAEVVVEGGAPFGLAPGRVLSTARAPERVRIEAEARGDGLLVVNDASWPGWTAELDGVEVPILVADAVVRAIPFPAGRHVLTMRYRPPELAAGFVVTLLGLAATAALAWSRRRRGAAAGD